MSEKHPLYVALDTLLGISTFNKAVRSFDVDSRLFFSRVVGLGTILTFSGLTILVLLYFGYKIALKQNLLEIVGQIISYVPLAVVLIFLYSKAIEKPISRFVENDTPVRSISNIPEEILHLLSASYLLAVGIGFRYVVFTMQPTTSETFAYKFGELVGMVFIDMVWIGLMMSGIGMIFLRFNKPEESLSEKQEAIEGRNKSR